MSQRHRTTEVTLPPKPELRAQAHRERHRIHEELSNVASQVSAGLDPDDLHEPGRGLEARPPPRPRRGQGQGRRAQARHAPLEDEDVEAPLGAAPGEGPRRLRLSPARVLSGSRLTTTAGGARRGGADHSSTVNP